MIQAGLTSNQILLGVAGILAIGWCCLRAVRRGDQVVGIFLRGLISAALVAGLAYFAGHKLEHFSGDFSADAISLLTVVAILGLSAGLLSVFWSPAIADFVASPLANIFDGGHEPPEAKPAYSAARFQRDAGHPDKAIELIRAQLNKFPNDPEGVMLLAEIQAVDLNDLVGASSSLEQFIHVSATSAPLAMAARMKLVHWHLDRENKDAARHELGKISAQFPDTLYALEAQQRLAQLNRDDTALPESKAEVPPRQLAAVYVKHLQRFPDDVAVREKLARLYVREFKRLDLATLEFEQLLQSPESSRKQKAEWLLRLFKAQVELDADLSTIKATLERIVREFSEQPAAKIARERLARLD